VVILRVLGYIEGVAILRGRGMYVVVHSCFDISFRNKTIEIGFLTYSPTQLVAFF
jgi:hypothetical protein